MKKKLCILVILIAVLLVGTVGCYFMPKKFGKNVNSSEVDHINAVSYTHLDVYKRQALQSP